jgi:hypothetical protein
MGASRSCISELSRTFRFLPSYLVIVEQGRMLEAVSVPISRFEKCGERRQTQHALENRHSYDINLKNIK